MKYWEIIADNLNKAGWSLGWVSAIDSKGRTIWITDAHRDDEKRIVVHSDEIMTAFLELELATRELSRFCNLDSSAPSSGHSAVYSVCLRRKNVLPRS
jgi:hypothetical protein